MEFFVLEFDVCSGLFSLNQLANLVHSWLRGQGSILVKKQIDYSTPIKEFVSQFVSSLLWDSYLYYFAFVQLLDLWGWTL